MFIERYLFPLSIFAEVDRPPIQRDGKGCCDAKIVAVVLAITCPLRLGVKDFARIVRNAIWPVKPRFWID